MTPRHVTNADLWTREGRGPVCISCLSQSHASCYDLMEVEGLGLMACDCDDISHIDPEEET